MTALSYWLHATPVLLWFWGFGAGLVLLLWPGRERLSAWEWAGFAWLAGVGAGTVLLGLFGLLLHGRDLVVTVGALGLAGAWAGWRWGAGRFTLHLWPVPGARWEKALVVIPLALMAFAFARTFHERLLADGLFTLEFKARVAFEHGGQFPALLFTDPTRLNTHPRNPLLVPMAELALYLGNGRADQTLALTISPPFYAAGVLILYGLVARRSSRLWMGAVATLLTVGVPTLLLDSFTLAHGYADYPLAICTFAAFAALLWESPQAGGAWPLAGLLAAFLPWIKAEGVLLWAVFAVAAGWLLRHCPWRRRLWIITPGAIVWLAWQAILRSIPALPETVFRPLDTTACAEAARRLAPVLSYFANELNQLETWGVLWWTLPAALVWGWGTRERGTIGLLFAVVLALLGLDLVPYLFTTLDLGFHLRTSCDRLVLQSSWLALLAVALGLTAVPAVGTPPSRGEAQGQGRPPAD